MKIVALCALVALCGCASVSVTTPDGFKFARHSWIWSNNKVANAEMTVDTNGTRTIKLAGYEQQNVENIPAIVSAVIQGYRAASTGTFGQ